MSNKSASQPMTVCTKMVVQSCKKNWLLMIISLCAAFIFEGQTLGMPSGRDTFGGDDLTTPLVPRPIKTLPDFTLSHTQKVLKQEDSLIRFKTEDIAAAREIISKEPPVVPAHTAAARQDRNLLIREYVSYLDDAFIMRCAMDNPDMMALRGIAPGQVEGAYREKQRVAIFFLSMYPISEAEFNAWMKARDSFWKVYCCCCFF